MPSFSHPRHTHVTQDLCSGSKGENTEWEVLASPHTTFGMSSPTSNFNLFTNVVIMVCVCVWRSEVNSEESIFCFYLYLDSGDQTWVTRLVSVKQLSPVEYRASTHVPFLSNLDLGFKHLTHKEPEAQRGKATDQPEHHTQQSQHPSIFRLPSPLQWLWLCPAGTG